MTIEGQKGNSLFRLGNSEAESLRIWNGLPNLTWMIEISKLKPGARVFAEHPAARFALVGDVLFSGSIGRTDFPRGNHQDLIRSIRENLFPLGDDVAFVPGHGPTSTFGRERAANPFVADRM